MSNARERHVNVLEHILSDLAQDYSDVVIIGDDGETVNTQRILLSFYSKMFADILGTFTPIGSISLALPVSSGSIRILLKILSKGVANLHYGQVEEVGEAAFLLGIPLPQCEIVPVENRNDTTNDIDVDVTDDKLDTHTKTYLDINFTKDIFNEANMPENTYRFEDLSKYRAKKQVFTSTPKECKFDRTNEEFHNLKFKCPKCSKTFQLMRELHKHVNTDNCKLKRVRVSNIFKKRRRHKSQDSVFEF